MKIRPIARVMTATALTNPDPAFVSLCTGPANQTPFHAVRSADGNHASVKLEDTMKIKRAKATTAVVLAQKGHSVMQFAFDKNVFKTAEEVTKWLSDGGYEQTEMTETSKAFEVSDASGTKFEVGSTEVIRNAVPGVTAYVGKLAGSTDEDQIVDDEPSTESAAADDKPEGTSEVTQKAEDEPARPDVQARERTRTEGEPAAPATTDAPAAEEPASAAPAEEPAATGCTTGTCEIEPELAQKIDAIFAAHPVTAKRGIGCYTIGDLASVISTLRYLIADADYTGIDDATVTNLKTAAKAAVSAVVSMVSQFSSEMSEVFRKDADATTIQRSAETTEGEPAPADPAPQTAAPTLAEITAMVTKAVADATAPLNQQVTDAQERARVAEEGATEARAEAQRAKDDLAARVEADNTRTQSRKAEDELDPTVSTPKAEEPVQRTRAQNRLLETFGSRHAR